MERDLGFVDEGERIDYKVYCDGPCKEISVELRLPGGKIYAMENERPDVEVRITLVFYWPLCTSKTFDYFYLQRKPAGQ